MFAVLSSFCVLPFFFFVLVVCWFLGLVCFFLQHWTTESFDASLAFAQGDESETIRK